MGHRLDVAGHPRRILKMPFQARPIGGLSFGENEDRDRPAHHLVIRLGILPS